MSLSSYNIQMHFQGLYCILNVKRKGEGAFKRVGVDIPSSLIRVLNEMIIIVREKICDLNWKQFRI